MRIDVEWRVKFPCAFSQLRKFSLSLSLSGFIDSQVLRGSIFITSRAIGRLSLFASSGTSNNDAGQQCKNGYRCDTASSADLGKENILLNNKQKRSLCEYYYVNNFTNIVTLIYYVIMALIFIYFYYYYKHKFIFTLFLLVTFLYYIYIYRILYCS